MPPKRRAVAPPEDLDRSVKRARSSLEANGNDDDDDNATTPKDTRRRAKSTKESAAESVLAIENIAREKGRAGKKTDKKNSLVAETTVAEKVKITKATTDSKAKGSRAAKEVKNEVTVQVEETEDKPKKQRSASRKTTALVTKKEDSDAEKLITKPGKPSTKSKTKKEISDVEELETKPKKTPAKRKTKEEKEAEAMPLKVRTEHLRMFVGAHVSGAGGVHNSVTNAVHIGGNAFALFLKSQRKWENPALKNEHRDEFKQLCNHHVYAADKHVLPHGSYLVNLAQLEKEKADQAYNSFLDDIKRCEALGIKLYNFHPGNTGSHPRGEAISRIAEQLNKAIKATSTVIPVLETMAGGNNVIGSTFEDLRDIINQVEDKSRIGVCIDTCHIFAAGYDIRTPETFTETVDKFDGIVGLRYLKGFHMNDSKAPFGSHRDLHQNIGLGFLGLRAFHNIMNEARFEDIPMVLETPTDRKDDKGKTFEDKSIWANEIKLLESLIGMDVGSQEFLALEKDLSTKGAAERAKLQEQVDKKAEKDAKKLGGGRGKKRKAAKDDDEDDNDVVDEDSD